MMADTCYYNVYQEILQLCSFQGVNFIKSDVDEMPPYEREGYIQIIKSEMERIEQEQKAKQLNQH